MKKSKLSLIAMILGIISSVFMLSVLFSSSGSADEAVQLGESIGKAIVLPSVICVVIAAILNIIGYFGSNRIVTLISAIFYVLGLILMPLWGFICIPSIILQFVAFSKMNKRVN